MSGHSKFANIKHKKEKNDAAKGKIFTKIGRELAVAVKDCCRIFCTGNLVFRDTSFRIAERFGIFINITRLLLMKPRVRLLRSTVAVK